MQPNESADQPSAPDQFDLELAALCSAGNRKAQHDLWERYKNRMYGVCQRLAGKRQDAEDMLQDGFVQVFRNIGNYKGIGSLEGWVRKIMIRTALQHLQKQQQIWRPIDPDTLERLADETAHFVDQGTETEPGKLIMLMQQLPPGFRTVLNLYVLEGKSHEEIARELSISIGTSKSQLNRAKAYLKRLFDKTLLLL